MDYDTILTALSKGIHTVTFNKVNGEERVMTCTRELDRIPLESRPKGESEVTKEVIRVFDTNAQAWRSFRVDSVTKFE